MTVKKPQLEGGCPGNTGAVWSNCLGKRQRGAAKTALVLFRARKVELGRSHEAFDGLRVALDHEKVAALYWFAARKALDPPAVPDEADDGDILFLCNRIEITHRDWLLLRDLADLQLGRIKTVGEPFVLRLFPEMRGQEAPAEQGDEGDAENGNRESDRCEIEHGKRTAKRIRPVFGNDDIGRCTDQGDHAAQDGRERQWHQRQAGRTARFLCRFEIERHQQGKRCHVVDDAGKACADHRHQRDVARKTSGSRQEMVCDQLDRPRVHQPL